MTESRLLEVGDVLYACSKYSRRCNIKAVITRVTKTRAIAGSIKLKRNGRDGYITVGAGNFTIFRLETPEMKSEYDRLNLEHQFSLLKAEKLSSSQLTEILKIVKGES